LEAGLTGFFRFYNEERLHAALNYLTPAIVYAAAWRIQRSRCRGPNQRHFSRKKFYRYTSWESGSAATRDLAYGSRGPLIPSI
jgi:hypothetical protein